MCSWRIRFGRFLLALPFVAAGFLAPATVRAQSALDYLDRLLGRGGKPKPEAPKTSTQAAPSEAPRTRPRSTRTSRGQGGEIQVLGHLDYGLVYRFHPLLANLHIDSRPDAAPLFLKPIHTKPRSSARGFLQELKAERTQIDAEIRSMQKRAAKLSVELKDMLAAEKARLNKLPPKTPAPERRRLEEAFFAKKKAKEDELENLLQALGTKRSQHGTLFSRSQSLKAFYHDEITKEIQTELQTVARERQLAIVLNVPSQPFPDQGPKSRQRRREDLTKNVNALAAFLQAPTASDYQKDIVGTHLVRWSGQSWEIRDTFPQGVQTQTVLYGGVDLTKEVLVRIYEKHQIPSEKIQALQDFLDIELKED